MPEKIITLDFADLQKESVQITQIKLLKNTKLTLNLTYDLKLTQPCFNYLNALPLTNLNLTVVNSPNLTQEEVSKILCTFVENLKETITIKNMPYQKEIAALLKKRLTYQGFKRSILNEVKRQIQLTVKKDSTVIDATVGNGHDTIFLAQMVPEGKVIGYDIQEKAIQNTKELTKDFTNVELHQESHENISQLEVNQNIALILFNLGYLPGGDKMITTKVKSTLNALKWGLKLLSDKGKILVVIYPGHPEGLKEQQAILKWLEEENINYQIKRNTPNPEAPFLVIIPRG